MILDEGAVRQALDALQGKNLAGRPAAPTAA